MEKLLTHRKAGVTLLLLGLVGIGVDYYNLFGYKIADPISNTALSFLAVGIFLFFTRNQVFSAWLKFAKWWIPLTVLLIVLSPTDGSSAFFPALFSKELTSMWMSGLFVVISLFIIGFRFFISKKGGVGE